MDESANNYLKGIVEALLFISEKPLVVEQIREVIEGVEVRDIRELIENLQREYEERKCGIRIIEIAGGYQMLTSESYADYIRKFYRKRHKEKLSKPSLETLAIVAYKNPVTRLDIELIRGVNSDGVVTHLLDKGLIKIAGRKDVPGRPFLYSPTRQFLEYFGLKSLADLPKLEDFPALEGAADGTETIKQPAAAQDAGSVKQQEPTTKGAAQ